MLLCTNTHTCIAGVLHVNVCPFVFSIAGVLYVNVCPFVFSIAGVLHVNVCPIVFMYFLVLSCLMISCHAFNSCVLSYVLSCV